MQTGKKKKKNAAILTTYIELGKSNSLFFLRSILKWLELANSSPRCPICKAKVVRSKMINHLYFSTHLDGLDHPEIPAAESPDPALEQEIARLRQSKDSVTNDLRISEERVVHLSHELMNSQARVKSLEEEVSHALHGKRYLKQIRR